MLHFFRNSYFINILLLLPYAILLRSRSFIYPEVYPLSESDSVIFQWINSLLQYSPLLQNIVATILVFITAVIINHHIKISRLASPIGLFAGAFYILFMSILPEFLGLHPIHFGNLLMAIAILSISRIYKRHSVFGDLFNIGFCIGVSVIFYLPYLCLVIPMIIGVFIMRSFKINERIIFFLALLCGPYLLCALLYWHDNLASFWPIFFTNNINFAVDLSHIGEIKNIARLGLFLIVILFASTRSFSLSRKKSVIARKSLDVLYWTFLFTIPSIFFIESLDFRHLQILMVPLSSIVGLAIFQWKNKALAEVLHFAFLALLIGFHFTDQLLTLLP